MKELNKKQKIAVDKINEGLMLCKKHGVYLFGMDNDLLYVTVDAVKEAQKEDPKIGKNYNYAADTHQKLERSRSDLRTGKFDDKGMYIDSGGW